MPTYEYLCDDCGYKFEEFQSITAEPLETCPKCHGHVQRLIGGGNGLIFKGSGFYITDYKKSNSTTKESAGTTEKKESKSTETSKTKNN
ncbi:MAG: zinc ribbon domain-containing protein [Calditrichaeota bacterium]|nr:MAG: zinc ribbon domain-containing protein [Calditrichota bacterium]